MVTATVSAPGKLILMGEHAAVYGRPALVAAFGLRLEAVARPHRRGRALLLLPGVAHEEETPWDEVLAHTARMREAWERYARRPAPETFAALANSDPAHLVKVALGEAAAVAGEPPEGVRLEIASELPPGSGFGSSAAAAVAVVAALLGLCGVEAGEEEVRRLSLEVERRQHGMPSGVDNATVLRGGVLWARRGAGGELAVEPLAPASPLLRRLAVFHSGAPAESTGAVVAAVRRRREEAPVAFDALLERMAAATESFREELRAPAPRPPRVVALMREYEACLEALGVVPEPVRAVIRRVEAEGGAAKISGAGSLAGPGGGSLLVYHPDAENIDRWNFLRSLTRYRALLGAAGLKREPAP